MIPQAYMDLLLEFDTTQNAHVRGSLYQHLSRTHNLLQEWGNPEHVCVAGLFHSIYGTEFYRIQSAGFSQRERIKSVIGQRAEELTFLFCTTQRRGFFMEAGKDCPTLLDKASAASVPVTHDTLAALIEIEVANFLDQINMYLVSERLLEYVRCMMLPFGKTHMSAQALHALEKLLEDAKAPGPRLVRFQVAVLREIYFLGARMKRRLAAKLAHRK